MKRRLIVILGILAALVAATAVFSFLARDPLRRYLERELNSRLTEYTVRIGTLDLHPFSLSLDLGNVVLVRKANREPPVADISRIHAGISWRRLLTANIAGSVKMVRPRLRISSAHRTRGMEKPAAEKEAWQDALREMYPVTINELRITNGEITYVAGKEAEQFTVSEIDFVAHDIQNTRSPGKAYPSPIRLEAAVGSGAITVTGRAGFLLKPFPGVKARFELKELELARFKEIADDFPVAVKKGTLNAAGTAEFAPDTKSLVLERVILRSPSLDYIYAGDAEKKKKRKMPDIAVRVERVQVVQGAVGFVNRPADPAYRLFINRLDVVILDVGSGSSRGPATLHVSGMFMGTGDTVVSATFRTGKKTPDFNIRIAVENTRMRAMNDLFRAYGNFAVEAGLFSYYSELTVRNNRINGYVKPLFKEMTVYDERTDEEKKVFQELIEKFAGGVTELLENPREAAATETRISGKVSDPGASPYEVLENLLQKAFFKSILPGFEKNIE